MGDNPRTVHINMNADEADLYHKVLPEPAEIFVSERWADDKSSKSYWRGFWWGYFTMLAVAIFNIWIS